LVRLSWAQPFSFNFFSSGQRVCLVESSVTVSPPSVTIHLLDAADNSSHSTDIYRRPAGSVSWLLVADGLTPGTPSWQDTDVSEGQVWEYLVKRPGTWSYESEVYDATGFTLGALRPDRSQRQGRLILLVADDAASGLGYRYQRLKEELAADGWTLDELVVPRAQGWDSGDTVVAIKSQIQARYNAAPVGDKPLCLFILGHVPLPRCGSTDVIAPDDHNENKGARGCDAFYADLDGVFTDVATYHPPGGLASPLAINLPGDFKWDQDFFPSDIEMAFGRVDFADLTDVGGTELELLANYLDRNSQFRQVAPGWDMGKASAFHFGYDNSNDGSYRSLPSLTGSAQVWQNYLGAPHPQWVAENGPFQLYMQNVSVPELSEWNAHGMHATVFSSDQSYWGFGDVPQNFSIYSRIRALLALDTRCLVTLWTTTGLNIFPQACSGIPFGLSLRDIMNHNASNQLLEKAPQFYDTEAWWNRTHFAFYGDPTLRLNQVAPPADPEVLAQGGQALLRWKSSPEAGLLGYHVYESDDLLGPFTRISASPIGDTSFVLPAYQTNRYYLVKAIALEQTGCGVFVNPSLGVRTQGTIVLGNVPPKNLEAVSVFPNPVLDEIFVLPNSPLRRVTLLDLRGAIVRTWSGQEALRVPDLPAGTYVLLLEGEDGSRQHTMLFKEKAGF